MVENSIFIEKITGGVTTSVETANALAKGMAYHPEYKKPSIVALIPARAGSKRVPGKNFRALAGYPLIFWAIRAAKDAGIFAKIIISTDADYAQTENVMAIRRPPEYAQDNSPDIDWVKHALKDIKADAFAILRPTSPFRTVQMIARAWDHFLQNQPADSLRAVEPVRQHPGKMWVLKGHRMQPLLPFWGDEAPWHSMPYQSLPAVYAQNSSLEIAWAKTVRDYDSISGMSVIPFLTQKPEGFTIDTEEDWREAERIMKERR